MQFTDRKNKKQAVMPAPVMWDATVDKRSGEHTNRARVGLKVVKKGSSVDLVVTPDTKFLTDPDTTYPVTVDPSTSSLSNVFDTYVQQGETVDWSTDTELDLGNPGTTNSDGTPRTARSFISWNTTPIQDGLVLDAKLSLWNFHSGNTDCKAYPWEVWSTGAASTSSRWTAQPTWTAKKATSTETNGNPGCCRPARRLDRRRRDHARAGVGLRQGDPRTHGPARLQRDRGRAVEARQLGQRSLQPAEAGGELQLPAAHGHQAGRPGPPYFSYGGAYTVEHHHPDAARHLRRRRR